jgi:hypothetical protein
MARLWDRVGPWAKAGRQGWTWAGHSSQYTTTPTEHCVANLTFLKTLVIWAELLLEPIAGSGDACEMLDAAGDNEISLVM